MTGTGHPGKSRSGMCVGHEIIPDKNGCVNEATAGLTLGLFVMPFQDVAFG
ncbi:MAG TPA: hypothetical protein VGC82_02185 [Rhodopila sp.]|jgi:hypothetical protein